VIPRPRKLLDPACTELCPSVRSAIRLKQYGHSTEEACVHWAKRFPLSVVLKTTFR